MSNIFSASKISYKTVTAIKTTVKSYIGVIFLYDLVKKNPQTTVENNLPF